MHVVTARFLSSTGLGCANVIARAQLPPAPALDKNRSPTYSDQSALRSAVACGDCEDDAYESEGEPDGFEKLPPPCMRLQKTWQTHEPLRLLNARSG